MNTVILTLLLMIGPTALAAGDSSSTSAWSTGAGQAQEPAVVCGFRNPSYTGICEERTAYVKAKKLETLCQPILDCLNDTRCIKTYCGSTTVRRGWVLESARREK